MPTSKKTAPKAKRAPLKKAAPPIVTTRPSREKLDAATKKTFEQYDQALKNLTRR
jgi:hypothetical protein